MGKPPKPIKRKMTAATGSIGVSLRGSTKTLIASTGFFRAIFAGSISIVEGKARKLTAATGFYRVLIASSESSVEKKRRLIAVTGMFAVRMAARARQFSLRI